MKRFIVLLFVSMTTLCSAQEDSSKVAVAEQPAVEPFAWGDFTWLNGNSRQHVAPTGWTPDLVKSETRFIFATLVRF